MTVKVNIVGVGRRSGKTALVEAITKKLSKRFNVWTVKHISKSFDTADKDTWRHFHAGAKVVVAVTNNEIITIKKSTVTSLDAVLLEVHDKVDLLLVEGFKKSNYPKIVVAQKIEDVREVLSVVSEVFAIYGGEAAERDWKAIEGVPVMRLMTLISLIEKLILNDVVKKLPGLNCKSCGFPTCEAFAQSMLNDEATLDMCKALLEAGVSLTVNGEIIYLSPFPGEFIRNTVLGMVGSLKGIDKSGINRVHLDIEV